MEKEIKEDIIMEKAMKSLKKNQDKLQELIKSGKLLQVFKPKNQEATLDNAIIKS